MVAGGRALRHPVAVVPDLARSNSKRTWSNADFCCAVRVLRP